MCDFGWLETAFGLPDGRRQASGPAQRCVDCMRASKTAVSTRARCPAAGRLHRRQVWSPGAGSRGGAGADCHPHHIHCGLRPAAAQERGPPASPPGGAPAAGPPAGCCPAVLPAPAALPRHPGILKAAAARPPALKARPSRPSSHTSSSTPQRSRKRSGVKPERCCEKRQNFAPGLPALWPSPSAPSRPPGVPGDELSPAQGQTRVRGWRSRRIICCTVPRRLIASAVVPHHVSLTSACCKNRSV